MLGVFFKTPGAYQQIEVLGSTGLDFVVLDTEHAPFDRGALDTAILAGRGVGLPVLVRVANTQPDTILSVLDMGACGIIVPHVTDAEMARRLAAACSYGEGTRGVSTSHRAAGYGQRELHAYLSRADLEVSLICQVEDGQGVDNAAAIAAVSGVDALFIGPVDLGVSLGATGPDAPAVDQAINRICAAAQPACAVGIFLGAAERIKDYRGRGISLFIVGSDQSLLRHAAQANVSRFREMVS